jgi:NADH:ubiquinone reductase (H+-translocating)
MEAKTIPNIIVVGGGYAGVLAANRLAGKLRGKAHVTLINRDAYFVERIRLHQVAAGEQPTRHALASLLRDTGADFLQGTVTTLNPAAQTVEVQTATGQQTLPYDKLVYAAGSRIAEGDIPGAAEYAHKLMPERIAALHDELEQAERLVIIGGGLTGIEASTELAEAYPYLQVTLITRDEFASRLSHKAQQYLGKTFAEMGIIVTECTEVTRIEPNAVVTGAGERLPYDVCLYAGAFAVPELAREAGLAVNEMGQLVVDDYLRAENYPNIYGAGDATFVPGIRMACATAMPMAAFAADNIVADLNGKARLPFQFAYVGKCISLGRKRGLVQMLHSDDAPKDLIFTGRTGAFIKEMICRFTIFMLRMERLRPGSYPRTFAALG